MSDALSIDVFWSFRSPWSYLATPRLTEWQRRFNLEVCFRPVYPIAIRTPEFFNTVNRLGGRYFAIDLGRVADFLEIPLTWPQPDPVVQFREDGRMRTADDPPHIHRLSRLGVVAEESGRGIQFADRVSTLIWGGTQNWHEGDHFARAAADAGLDLEDLDARALEDADRLDVLMWRLKENGPKNADAPLGTCAMGSWASDLLGSVLN